jgi:hypothetical protein
VITMLMIDQIGSHDSLWADNFGWPRQRQTVCEMYHRPFEARPIHFMRIVVPTGPRILPSPRFSVIPLMLSDDPVGLSLRSRGGGPSRCCVPAAKMLQ